MRRRRRAASKTTSKATSTAAHASQARSKATFDGAKAALASCRLVDSEAHSLLVTSATTCALATALCSSCGLCWTLPHFTCVQASPASSQRTTNSEEPPAAATPSPSPSPSSPPLPISCPAVRVATWNVHGFADAPLRDIARAIRASRADIVGLQEVPISAKTRLASKQLYPVTQHTAGL